MRLRYLIDERDRYGSPFLFAAGLKDSETWAGLYQISSISLEIDGSISVTCFDQLLACNCREARNRLLQINSAGNDVKQPG